MYVWNHLDILINMKLKYYHLQNVSSVNIDTGYTFVYIEQTWNSWKDISNSRNDHKYILFKTSYKTTKIIYFNVTYLFCKINYSVNIKKKFCLDFLHCKWVTLKFESNDKSSHSINNKFHQLFVRIFCRFSTVLSINLTIKSLKNTLKKNLLKQFE